MVLYILPGIFVAGTNLGTQLGPTGGIFAITCQNSVLVLILAAGRGIVDVFQIILSIRGGIVKLQLATQREGMFANRHGVVQLEDMVGGLVFVL